MLIHKHLSLSDVELKFDGNSGQFAGYASVFGGVDSYGDTIEKGAFAETLQLHGAPKMFFNHDWTMPIGKYTASEDEKGLFVKGELTPGLALAADVRAAMQHGTIDGLSIGGYLKKGDYTETKDGRTVHKWSKLIEVSPVVFPADGNARIEAGSIKSELVDAIAEIESIRDFERFLRDAGSFSKGAAVALVARAKNVFGTEGDPGDPTIEAKAQAELNDRLQRIAQRTA